MKHLFFYTLFFIVIFNTYAQQASLSAGNNATGSGGSVSYSIGQIVYTTNTGTTGSMAQGVQQPYEISTLGTDTFPEMSLKFNAFPNPTVDVLTLSIEDYDLTNLSYQMIDINGKIIETHKINQVQTILNMSNRVSALYFIAINDNNKTLKTFKIIKK